ncbi:MAG: CheR family methyltransferase [Bacteroidales bacterium]
MQKKGIDISRYEEMFLEKSINNRFLDKNCLSEDMYIELLENNDEEVDLFLGSLQNSHSEFFRNSLTFSVLEHILIPSIILKKKSTIRKEVRIWSAACAAGQEAYSLSIIFEEFNNCKNERFKFRIFATDQSQVQLTEAQKGEYEFSSLNNVNLKRINQCFDKNGKSYKIKPELKKNIDFSVFDLLNEHLSSPPRSIFGDFDIVFCANLLFYYKPQYRRIIMDKVENCMAEDGLLITGETEREIFLNNNFREVYPYSAIFQKIKK